MGQVLREWGIEWIRGSIRSYFLGTTSLDMLKGKIRRAIKSYDVKPEEVETITNLLILDPGLNVPKSLREEKAKPLLEYVSQLKSGEKRG